MSQKLIGLDTKIYEHPFDRAALEALRALPMFDKVTNFVLNWTTIKWQIVQLCGSNFHVTQESCPELYDIVKKAADTLDVHKMPEIYTQWTYGINAYTTGYKNDAILVLYTGAVDLLPDDELTFIVGHELGHVKSGHVLYHVMGRFLAEIVTSMSLAKPFVTPIQLALGYWNRMSEFTSDRAGLLACQNIDSALTAIMKMAGIPKRYFNTANPHVFAKQAEEFLCKYGDTANTIIKNISILDDTHPWTIMRAAELIKWYEGGEYEAIIKGHPTKVCPVCQGEFPLSTKKCPVDGYVF